MTDMQIEQLLKARNAIRTAGETRQGIALLGIGTAAPPSISQAEATAVSEEFACETEGQRAWLRRVYSRSGVGQRGSVLQDGKDGVRKFYGAPAIAGKRGPSTHTRMERYAIEAPPLMERAACRALLEADIASQDITNIITVSCTGFFAPGLDVELIMRLGLRHDVRRMHIGFMGCHAAFNSLAAARDIVRADPEALVLVCCVELSTLHFAYGWNPEKLVANALFADGASACVAGGAHRAADGAGWRLLDTASLLLPNSRGAMTWRVGDHGFEMTLSAELPALIGSHIRPWCETWLAKQGRAIADIHHWAIHPGGPKILHAAGNALALPAEALWPSFDILAHHGNMSSATVLFILQHIAKQPGKGSCVAIGFGPGLMAEAMLLEL